MTHHIVIQHAAVSTAAVPNEDLLQKWASLALGEENADAEMTIRIVDNDEIASLNEQYRHKKGPTNVLSFPFEAPPEMKLHEIGDVVICADIVNHEAETQGKQREAHWAHMVIHGVLHLLGHDHVEDAEAEEMEAIEIELLKQLGFANPYESGESIKQYE